MNQLFIRHYIPAPQSGTLCTPCDETSRYLQSMVQELSPKLVNLNIQMVLQNMEIHEITERNAGKLNYISFLAPELGLVAEKSIEEVLHAPVSYEECAGCTLADGAAFQGRTLGVNGKSFQVLPPDILTDALIRVVFSTMGGCSDGSCNSCAGCGQH